MILTSEDLKMKWGIGGNTFYKRVSYNITKKSLFRIQNGLFSDIPLDEITERDCMVAAARMNQPSYVSFETVLAMEGVNFQYSPVFHIATLGSTRDEKMHSLGISVRFQHLPKEILLNPLGVVHADCSIASKERAIADTLYRSPGFYFDALHNLNINLLKQLARLYGSVSKRTEKQLFSIISNYENENN